MHDALQENASLRTRVENLQELSERRESERRTSRDTDSRLISELEMAHRERTSSSATVERLKQVRFTVRTRNIDGETCKGAQNFEENKKEVVTLERVLIQNQILITTKGKKKDRLGTETLGWGDNTRIVFFTSRIPKILD